MHTAAVLISLCLVSASPAERAEALGVVLTEAPPLREKIYRGVLGDIYAHNDVAETIATYGDVYSLGHEGTHGSNSVVRNRYGGWDRVNAMYVANNQAIVINEPRVSLVLVSRYLPGNMRGMSYQTYFVESLADWEHYTLYILDEWSSYVNSSWVGAQNGRVRYSDSLQMAEFTVYAIVAVVAVAANRPDYDMMQLRGAVAWMCEQRVMPLLAYPGAEAGRAHWEKFRTSRSTAELRQFVRDYFGHEWTKQVLNF